MNHTNIILKYSYPFLTILSAAYLVAAYSNTIEPVVSISFSISVGLLVLGAWPLTTTLKKYLKENHD